MAVLVGPGPEEEDVWEAADCNPVTGRKQNSHLLKHIFCTLHVCNSCKVICTSWWLTVSNALQMTRCLSCLSCCRQVAQHQLQVVCNACHCDEKKSCQVLPHATHYIDVTCAGCSAVPWRYFARPHPVGAWVCSPVDRAGPEPPGPGLVEEQPPDDGKVATVDPLIGLLGMQVVLQPEVQWH